MRWGHCRHPAAVTPLDDLTHRAGRREAASHVVTKPYQRTHHLMTEGIGPDPEVEAITTGLPA